MKTNRCSAVLYVIPIVAMLFLMVEPAKSATVDKDGVIHWKAQSSWIRGEGCQEWADYFTETLNTICKGELVIDKMHAADEIVGAFEVIPACSKGSFDIVASSGYYLFGTLPLLSLIMGASASAMDYADAYVAWQWEGGGLELYQEYLDTKYNLKVFPTVIMPSEPLYSIKPITKKEDFKGLKIRGTGMAMAYWNSLGATTVNMPMSEIIPSLEKKVLDAADFNVPYSDYPAHIVKVAPYCLFGNLHQPPAICQSFFINKDSWNQLSDHLKKKVEYAVKLTQYWNIYHLGWKNAVCYQKQLDEGMKPIIADAELQSWLTQKADELGEKYAKEDPFAKKILDSQREFLKVYNKSLLSG